MSTPPTNGPPTSLLNLDLRPSGSAIRSTSWNSELHSRRKPYAIMGTLYYLGNVLPFFRLQHFTLSFTR